MRRVSTPQKPKLGEGKLIVVAVNADKNSQQALKWAADHLISKGQSFVLLHVRKKVNVFQTPSGNQLAISDVTDDVAATLTEQINLQIEELLLPFQCFCSKRGLQCNEVILDGTDVPKTIAEYIEQHSVDKLVLGATSRGAIARAFKSADVPTSLSKLAPDFCTVYIISKGKISSVRPATRSNRTITMGQQSWISESSGKSESPKSSFESDRSDPFPRQDVSPSLMVKGMRNMHHYDRCAAKLSNENKADEKSNKISQGGGYIEFLSGNESSCTSPRSSSIDHSIDKLLPFSPRENIGQSRLHVQSGNSYGSPIPSGNDFRFGYFQRDRTDIRSQISGPYMQSESPYSDNQMRSFDSGTSYVSSVPSYFQEFGRASWSSQSIEDVDADMRNVKLELQQNAVRVETLNRREKGADAYAPEGEDYLQNGAKYPDMSIGSTEEKLWNGRTVETHAIKKMESQSGQRQLEGKYLLQKEENRKIVEKLSVDFRYRRYSVEDIEKATNNFSEKLKIGEGGYGPVFKSSLDHTVVAIKILGSDATQGMKQFQQEIEVLSCIRHPNMVLLMGACPEYGCLVYEYMANGSLDDCLFIINNNRPPLSWQLRFKIAAEIATGLLFLHETKPEPLVHRDLKPGNILLDQNFVSKIADVGLARLIPPAAADAMTRCKMTATAGTFCYIDPEYQQTGLLGIKSDIYALGIILLQLLTASPPMGLAHNVEIALETGRFGRMLDPNVPDWPMEEAIKFAKLALSCVELRRRDRPDLGTVVLPQLNDFREFAERSQAQMGNYRGGHIRDNQEVTASDVSWGDDNDDGGRGSGEDDRIKSPFMR